MAQSKYTSETGEYLTTDDIFKFTDLYFSRKNILYTHMYNSFNQFIDGIMNFLKENENMFYERPSADGKSIIKYKFEFTDIAIRPPTIEKTGKPMFPSDARNENLTYAGKISAKVTQVQETKDIATKKVTRRVIGEPENSVPIAAIPIMMRSKYCSLNIYKNMENQECDYDPGCHFTIDGNEKIVISQERMCDNKPLVFMKKDSSSQTYACSIQSHSPKITGPVQIISIMMKKDGNMLMHVPIFNEFPVLILMRLFGIETDKELMDYIVGDSADVEMMELVKTAIMQTVNDKGVVIRTQDEAENYLVNKIRIIKNYSNDKDIRAKEKKLHLETLIDNNFLPHITGNRIRKAYFIGYMINKLLKCVLKRTEPDDRDSCQNKRVELVGELMNDLFKQFFRKMLNECSKHFASRHQSDENPINIINQIRPNTIEQGIKAALMTGMWGKKKGVAQVYPRLTYQQSIVFLRRIDSPSNDASVSKLTHPRYVHPTQVGMLCLTGDSVVQLDNCVELIKNLTKDDSVMTFTNNFELRTSGTWKHFSKMASKIFIITTETGRQVKCTPEHKLMLQNGKSYQFIPAEYMIPGVPLIVRHMPRYIESTLVPKEFFDLLSIDYYQTLTQTRKLEHLSIHDVEISARITGFIHGSNGSKFTNGSLHLTVDNIIDRNKLYADLETLGFARIQKNNNKVTVWGGDCSYLQILCGVESSEFVRVYRVPKWIMNSDHRIQRAFLDGFSSATKTSNENIADGFVSEIDSMVKFNDVCILFNNLGIKCAPYIDNENSKIFIQFEKNDENLIELLDIISPVYNYRVNNNAVEQVEYMKYLFHMSNHMENKCQTIVEMMIRKEGVKKISQETNIPKEYVANFLNLIKNNVLLSHLSTLVKNSLFKEIIKNEMSFKKFKKIYKIKTNDGTIVFAIPIHTVKTETSEGIPVYDFETVSETHNFIVNGIGSSNCIIETPEHAKVGLIKELSMIGSVTVMPPDLSTIIQNVIEKEYIPLEQVHPSNMIKFTKVIINGNWIGMCENAIKLFKKLKGYKYNGTIHPNTSISYDDINDELKIYCDTGRMYRPVIRVENNQLLLTKKHVDSISIDKQKGKISSFEEFMIKNPGLVEYIDVDEQAFSLVANQVESLYEMEKRMNVSQQKAKDYSYTDKTNRYGEMSFTRFTHCDFHPSLLLGMIATNIPFCNHNPGPRSVFQYAQGKQAMCVPMTNYRYRIDKTMVLYHPAKSMVNTRTSRYANTDKLSPGENAVVAIACYTGLNQEDSVVINQSAIDRGLFRSTSYEKYSAEISKNQSTSLEDVFMKPNPAQVSDMKPMSYDKLNEKGYVPEETTVTSNDIIIGKVTPIQPSGNSTKIYKDSSKAYQQQTTGVIDRVITDITTVDGYDMLKVRTRSERTPIVGDKFCILGTTEVLTTDGWIPIMNITKNHKVASLVNDEYIHYVNPIDVYEFQYNGDMYKLRSNMVDLDVTMDHQMYVKPIDENSFRLIPARDVIRKQISYKILFSEYIADSISDVDLFEEKQKSESIYHYDGHVYCLEVPSHVFLVRQNGKNVWTGNCSRRTSCLCHDKSHGKSTSWWAMISNCRNILLSSQY